VLLFSKLMWERVDERFHDCYLTGPEAAALNSVSRTRDETASS
jgi:hypothetical protein